jgi:D-alanine-D-alanine ligase-like ATP-grasp enzyme
VTNVSIRASPSQPSTWNALIATFCTRLRVASSRAPRASVPGEIVVHDPDGFYDFEAKYLSGEQKASVQAHANLDDATRRRVQKVAIKAFHHISGNPELRVNPGMVLGSFT